MAAAYLSLSLRELFLPMPDMRDSTEAIEFQLEDEVRMVEGFRDAQKAHRSHKNSVSAAAWRGFEVANPGTTKVEKLCPA